MDLDGKCAIVTGGARGIGAAIAKAIVEAGGRVAIADLDLQKARSFADELVSGGAEAIPLSVDVSDNDSVGALLASTHDAFGKLDILVNNAGIVLPDDKSVEDTPEEVWDKTINVNLKSMFLTCKHAVPLMEKTGGSIVNIASIVGLLGSFPSQIAYTASKGGVIAFSRELAVVLARRGIRVNTICPGVTKTDLGLQIAPDEEAMALRRLHIPMGRMARPDEIAAMAVFLASEKSSYITGQILPVDGGMVGAYLTPPD